MSPAQSDDEPVPRGLEHIFVQSPQPRDRRLRADRAEVDGRERIHADFVRLAVQFLVIPLDVAGRLDDRGRTFARACPPARRRLVGDGEDDGARRIPAAQFGREIEEVVVVRPGVLRETAGQIGSVQCRQSGQ